jgi:hypothetical protein
VLHAQEDANCIGIERCPVAIFCLVDHDARLALGTGVVDRNVEQPESCDSLVRGY